MLMQQDWLMRQIELVISAVLQLLSGEKRGSADGAGQEESAGLSQELTGLLREGKLGKAEDLLFLKLEKEGRGALTQAVEFYRQANALSDRELEAQGFTRSELLEGLRDAAGLCGLPLPEVWTQPYWKQD